jgi:signal recognition particle GTPase
MEEALTRILTPRRSIDILRDVQAAKERGKPYVVVFVGVNGVGKSTNLAKVQYLSNAVHENCIYFEELSHAIVFYLCRLLIGFFSITSV